MPANDWLTQEELLAELGHAGITLAERTLRFWISNGVLAAPVRKPYRGADGRVGYYPRETLALVPRVLKLQEEGWKLRQIKLRLEEGATPASRATQVAWQEGEQAARRYLSDLLSDTESRDRRRCFSSSGAPASELRQLRHYLVARLERWLGRSTAVRATSAFLLELDEKEVRRLQARLRVGSSQRAEEGAGQESPAPVAFPSPARAREIAQDVGQAVQGLRAWLDRPNPPLLLRRALSALEETRGTLSGEPRDAQRLASNLQLLEAVERQAVEDLAFLDGNN